MKKRFLDYVKDKDMILSDTVLEIHYSKAIEAISKGQNTISTTPEFFLRLVEAAKWLKIITKIED